MSNKATSYTGDPAYPNLLTAVQRVLERREAMKPTEKALGGFHIRMRHELDLALDELKDAYAAVGVGDG